MTDDLNTARSEIVRLVRYLVCKTWSSPELLSFYLGRHTLAWVAYTARFEVHDISGCSILMLCFHGVAVLIQIHVGIP